MAFQHAALFHLLLAVITPFFSMSAFQNVTTLLDNHPDYSTFNGLLSTYGVAAQVNSRTTITVLCPPNHVADAFMAAQGSALDRQSLFNILSFHVLLDYEDPAKLRSLAGGFATITTLFQTTGLAAGEEGFINITESGGVAKIRRPGTTSFATIGSTALEAFPFNISLLTVNQVLVPTGIGGPAPPPVNVTQIISQAGNFSKFVSLLVLTGVDKVLQAHDTPPGVTIFAPTNAAFDRLGDHAISTLTNAQLVALLEYHALASFYPTEELASASGPQSTLASGSGGGQYSLTLSQDKAGIITVSAANDKVPIAGTLYSNYPVAVFVIDSALLPAEVFGAAAQSPASAQAPGPAPETSKPPTSPATSPLKSPLPTPQSQPPALSPSPPPTHSSSAAPVPAVASTSPPAPPLLAPGLFPPHTSGPELAPSPNNPTSAASHFTFSSTLFGFILSATAFFFSLV